MSLKTIVKNAGWLGLIQGLNYVVPFLTVPIVTRAFGPALYGILAALIAYGQYVDVIVNYGFNFTGLRTIARTRDNIDALSKTVSAIFATQVILGVVAVVFLFPALPFIIPSSADYKFVALIVLVQIFANAAIPRWAFIGLEHLRGLAIPQFVFRVLATIAIVSLIRTPHDLLLYVSINCMAALAILVFSLIALTQHQIRWYTPHFSELVLVMRRGAYIFISKVSISFYTTSVTLFVAIMLGPAAAGVFALANRVRIMAASIIGPMNVAIYPLVYRVVGGLESDDAEWTQQIFFLAIVTMSALISVALFIFAPLIVSLLAGDSFRGAILLLRIFAFLPFIITVSNRFGYQTMLALGMDRQFMWIVISAAVLGVAGLFLLMSKFGLVGAACGSLAVEIYVAVALAVAVNKRKNILSLFSGKL